MSGSFPADPWEPSILPALDLANAEQVRAYQVRAVAWGERVGYTIDEQRDMLQMLGLWDAA